MKRLRNGAVRGWLLLPAIAVVMVAVFYPLVLVYVALAMALWMLLDDLVLPWLERRDAAWGEMVDEESRRTYSGPCGTCGEVVIVSSTESPPMPLHCEPFCTRPPVQPLRQLDEYEQARAEERRRLG